MHGPARRPASIKTADPLRRCHMVLQWLQHGRRLGQPATTTSQPPRESLSSHDVAFTGERVGTAWRCQFDTIFFGQRVTATGEVGLGAMLDMMRAHTKMMGGAHAGGGTCRLCTCSTAVRRAAAQARRRTGPAVAMGN